MLGHRFPNPIIGVVGPFPDHRSCNFGTIIFNKYLTTTGFGRELRQDVAYGPERPMLLRNRMSARGPRATVAHSFGVVLGGNSRRRTSLQSGAGCVAICRSTASFACCSAVKSSALKTAGGDNAHSDVLWMIATTRHPSCVASSSRSMKWSR